MNMNIEQARENMVEQQVRPWDVLDDRVLGAMRSVHREAFAPAAYRAHAFTDIAIPIGHGEVMLPPKVEGRMLQALALRPTDSVLEIGTGTGYTAALLRLLADRVVSVDLHGDFLENAKANLAAADSEPVTLLEADALKGAPVPERFDAIVFTGALQTLPGWALEALNPGGRLFAVLARGAVQSATVTTLAPSGAPHTVAEFETEIPWLVGAEPKPAFAF